MRYEKLFNEKVIFNEVESLRKANQKEKEVDKDYDDPHTTIAKIVSPWIL